MNYRLALDLGSTSIGWAVFALDKDSKPKAIVKIGSRIFSDGRDAKTSASLAVTRREARQARRRRDRLLKRKVRLTNALIELGFFPKDDDQRRALVKLNPYALRAKGLDEQLSAGEFARALFHLNQRRGFKSNRKTDQKDNEAGALKNAIKDMRDILTDNQSRTVGEWLNQRHNAKLSVRARLRGTKQSDKRYDFYIDRAMVEEEFDLLFDKQAEFSPQLFSTQAKTTLKDILLFQRALKPVTPGRCTLLPEETRAPLALPSQQQFRIYQELNNLHLINADLSTTPLTKEQRDDIAEQLNRKAKLTFKAIRKHLQLTAAHKFNLEDIKRSELMGNKTAAILAKPSLLGERWFELSLTEQDELVEKLLHTENEHELIGWLQERLDIDEGLAEALSAVTLPESYGRLSSAALGRILPHSKAQVITYSNAVIQAGFASHSALENSTERYERLPYYGIPLQRHVAFAVDNPQNEEQRYGKIANPTVHIGLNQIRVVINTLIKKYGRPAQVVIEVARDLKNSKLQQERIIKEQAANQQRNQLLVNEACEILAIDNTTLSASKRRALSQKMQLWVELNPQDPLNRLCPFTGEKISIHQLLSEQVEIEHILPFSRTLDDGMANKTVAMRTANRIKANKTPAEAFAHDQARYEQMLQRVSNMPRNKAFRFAADGLQTWLREHNDFLARALNDTRYLSRLAREYLTCICPKEQVWVIPGQLTAKLRHHLQLNHLLSGDEHKTRDDHRHHAIDAIVVGLTDRGLLQRFATANAQYRQQGMQRLIDNLAAPWPTFQQHVERAINELVVSHKPDHGYQGAMLEESAWGLKKPEKGVRRVRDDFAEQRSRKETPRTSLIALNSGQNTQRHGETSDGSTKPYKAYKGGSNYCIEIFLNAKGKWQGEVISRYQAYQVIREYGESAGWQRLRHPKLCQNGQKLIMRLMRNDCVSLQIDPTTTSKRLYRVANMRHDGRINLCEIHQANIDKRDKDKTISFNYLNKKASTLEKIKTTKITITPIGEVKKHDRQNC